MYLHILLSPYLCYYWDNAKLELHSIPNYKYSYLCYFKSYKMNNYKAQLFTPLSRLPNKTWGPNNKFDTEKGKRFFL